MPAAGQLITDNLAIWSSAVQTRSAAGRGKKNKLELYGIKKLRDLILELAVRGLLVPQDPNDEPASELLKSIAAEKAKLVKDGEIKKLKALPAIEADEKPFDLPEGWEWVRLREIGHDWGQKKPDSDFTYIDVGAINKELGFVSEPSVLTESEAPSRARKIVKKGTVIYSTVRPYLLNIAVINEDFDPEPIASTAFAIIHPFEGILASFIYRYLRSPAFISYVEGCQTGIAYPAVNDKQFFSGLLPLPPTAEQHRIVVKVDELMALCDQLEQQQETSITGHQTLVQTVLDALIMASERDAFTAAWGRIADNFDTLFTTEWSIDQLKQNILQLAVMGKLVAQDPKDEPASELVDRIIAERDRSIKEEGLRTKASTEISTSEEYIENEDGWEYCRLGNLAKFIDYRGRTPKKIDSGVPLITAKNVRVGYISREPREYISEDEYFEWMTRGFPEVGDLLFTTEAPLGNVALLDIQERFALAQRVICFQFHLPHIAPFLKVLIMSSLFQEQLADKATGMTATGIKSARLKEIPIPLPPLKEQNRIVAKVDELVALCDKLKTGIDTAQATQSQLAETIAATVVV